MVPFRQERMQGGIELEDEIKINEKRARQHEITASGRILSYCTSEQTCDFLKFVDCIPLEKGRSVLADARHRGFDVARVFRVKSFPAPPDLADPHPTLRSPLFPLGLLDQFFNCFTSVLILLGGPGGEQDFQRLLLR